jgi:hypothetical protein
MVGGLLFLRRLFAAPALVQYVVRETTPGSGVATDGELLNYAHAMSVVDGELNQGVTKGVFRPKSDRVSPSKGVPEKRTPEATAAC